MQQASAKLRGKEGTTVSFRSIVPAPDAHRNDHAREDPSARASYAKMLPNNIGYVAAFGFRPDTGAELIRALNRLQQQARGLVSTCATTAAAT